MTSANKALRLKEKINGMNDLRETWIQAPSPDWDYVKLLESKISGLRHTLNDLRVFLSIMY